MGGIIFCASQKLQKQHKKTIPKQHFFHRPFILFYFAVRKNSQYLTTGSFTVCESPYIFMLPRPDGVKRAQIIGSRVAIKGRGAVVMRIWLTEYVLV